MKLLLKIGIEISKKKGRIGLEHLAITERQLALLERHVMTEQLLAEIVIERHLAELGQTTVKERTVIERHLVELGQTAIKERTVIERHLVELGQTAIKELIVIERHLVELE